MKLNTFKLPFAKSTTFGASMNSTKLIADAVEKKTPAPDCISASSEVKGRNHWFQNITTRLAGQWKEVYIIVPESLK